MQCGKTNAVLHGSGQGGCVMIAREAEARVREMLRHFPVVAVTGPRQAGKTTLLRSMFPDWEYFNVESTSTRELIGADPEAFLRRHGRSVILDEVQRVPDLLSQIQVLVDDDGMKGRIIVSGSLDIALRGSRCSAGIEPPRWFGVSHRDACG
jgi:predicted AAA+ superfamily ATPase